MNWASWSALEISREHASFRKHGGEISLTVLLAPELELLIARLRVVLQEDAPCADRDVLTLTVHGEDSLALDLEDGVAERAVQLTRKKRQIVDSVEVVGCVEAAEYRKDADRK